MSVESVLKARKAEVLTFRVMGRPASLKNSRSSRGNYTAVNPVARARLDDAKRQLREQHKGKPLEGCYHLEVRCFYKDRRWWQDVDATACFVMDAIKGVVVVDDKPQFIESLMVRSQLSRLKESYLEIELKEVT